VEEDETQKALKAAAGLRLAGTINVGVGIAIAIFMYAMGLKSVAFAGLFPGIVGVALLLNAGGFAPKPPSSRQ
jgi:UDP-N-acetylenolpyruvoylglucosamine reductase